MKLYRATVLNLCDDEDYLKSTIYLDYSQFYVIRETEHFYVIKLNGKEKRIGKKSKSQFASESKEIALNNAYHRNNRYRSILNSKLQYAKRVNNFLKDQLK